MRPEPPQSSAEMAGVVAVHEPALRPEVPVCHFCTLNWLMPILPRLENDRKKFVSFQDIRG